MSGDSQGIVNPEMEGLGSGGFSDVDDFAVVSFYGGGNTSVSGKPFPDSTPAECDSLFSQLGADGVQYMVSQNGNEKMTIHPLFLPMVNGAQTKL